MSASRTLWQRFRVAAIDFLSEGDDWKYWVKQVPNALSTFRLMIAVGIAFAAAFHPRWHSLVMAGAIVGYLTDAIDGWLARKLRAQSDYGKFVDPLADKFLVGVIVLYVIVAGNYDWVDLVCAAIITCREIHVTYHRSKFAMGMRMLDPTALSKWKAMLQYIVTFLFLMPIPEWTSVSLWRTSLSFFLLFTAFITCATWWEYLDPRGRKINWGWLPSPALQLCFFLESWRKWIAGA